MAHDCDAHRLPSFGLPHGCYACCKIALRAGEHLSAEELVFVGYESERRTDGWRQPGGMSTYELDSMLSPEDTALMQSLMMVGDDPMRVEFLS